MPASRPHRALVSSRRSHSQLVGALLIALAIALGLAVPPPTAEADASATLTVGDSSALSKIGSSRLTSIAEVKVRVPSTAMEVGVQFRAKAKSSGYRAKLKFEANGELTGSFSRVKSNKQSALGSPRALGFRVQPGDTVHLEATVAAKKTVRLYLRAWKDGSPRPSRWQMAAKDSSSKRIATRGNTYLWALGAAKTSKVALLFTTVSVAPFSAARAASIGIGASFPPPSADTFSIAVIGDTQTETIWSADTRFADRTTWLAQHKYDLDLRYAIHTGDVVNWGWLDSAQYTRATKAMSRLTDAAIPWSVAVGNHDTRSPGWNNVAGSTAYGDGPYSKNPECPDRLSTYLCNHWRLMRQTQEFNSSFPVSILAGLGGTLEPGKIDNSWVTFNASGTKWLVLHLEFAPRKHAVEWARKVVAGHTDHNVILATHSYLTSKGAISKSNAGDGETARYVYDHIVSKYSNVKIVLSGHVGHFTSRTDSNKGNVTASYLGNYLNGKNNPVRILTINTGTGELSNTVYSEVGPRGAITHSTGSVKISIIK